MKLDYTLINGNDTCSHLMAKSINNTKKVHYKAYKNTTIYNEDTVEVEDGKNLFTITGADSAVSFLEVEFFDKDGVKFLPTNIEYLTNLLPSNGGNSIFTMMPDGTLKVNYYKNKQYTDSGKFSHSIQIVWDDDEDNNRELNIAFDII